MFVFESRWNDLDLISLVQPSFKSTDFAKISSAVSGVNFVWRSWHTRCRLWTLCWSIKSVYYQYHKVLPKCCQQKGAQTNFKGLLYWQPVFVHYLLNVLSRWGQKGVTVNYQFHLLGENEILSCFGPAKGHSNCHYSIFKMLYISCFQRQPKFHSNITKLKKYYHCRIVACFRWDVTD